MVYNGDIARITRYEIICLQMCIGLALFRGTRLGFTWIPGRLQLVRILRDPRKDFLMSQADDAPWRGLCQVVGLGRPMAWWVDSRPAVAPPVYDTISIIQVRHELGCVQFEVEVSTPSWNAWRGLEGFLRNLENRNRSNAAYRRGRNNEVYLVHTPKGKPGPATRDVYVPGYWVPRLVLTSACRQWPTVGQLILAMTRASWILDEIIVDVITDRSQAWPDLVFGEGALNPPNPGLDRWYAFDVSIILLCSCYLNPMPRTIPIL